MLRPELWHVGAATVSSVKIIEIVGAHRNLESCAHVRNLPCFMTSSAEDNIQITTLTQIPGVDSPGYIIVITSRLCNGMNIILSVKQLHDLKNTRMCPIN